LGVAYISPFIGRLDDAGENGIELIQHLRHVLDWYGLETQLLAASIRDTQHLEHAIIAGADVVSVPEAVFEKSLSHELTDKGMEQFITDWKKLNVHTFP
jgi:transaldolase